MPALSWKARLLQFWKDRPRRRELIVTDITRMEGDRVCVGGYLEDRTAVRPVTGRAGPDEAWLRPARQALLERTAFASVRAIFAAEVHADPQSQWGRYVRSGEGERSLGTIRAAGIEAVHYRHYPERSRWDYRLRFADESSEVFQLAVVDLAFRRRLDALRDSGTRPDAAARTLLHELQRQTVYLRIGLARGWERHPDRCYLQITGVYGFAVGDG